MTLLLWITQERRGRKHFCLSAPFSNAHSQRRPPVTLNLFVSLGPCGAYWGVAGVMHTNASDTISLYELNKHANSLRDAMDLSALFGTVLSHFCCFVALIAFVIERCLNQAVAALNEMLIRDSETHSPLILCYFSRKMRIIFSNATC